MCAPASGLAQQYFDPGLLQRTIEQKPDDFLAVGDVIGSFNLNLGADLVFQHNDNIFYLPENEISDSLWQARFRGSLNSDWTRHALNLSAWADIARHDDYDVQDYEDAAARLDGRIDVRRDSWFTYEASTMLLHEDRRNPDDRFGIKPTDFDYSGLGGGYDHVFNRLKAGVYFRRNTFDYDDNRDADGNAIDNQDRDRDQDTLSLRVDYQVQPERSVFASYARNEVNYDQRLDRNGFARSSDGDAYTVGMNWDLTGILVGDLSLSYRSQQYADPRLQDVEGLVLGAGLRWSPTQKTLVSVRMAGGPQDTTQANASGYMSRLYSVRVQHELRRRMLLHARVSYTDNDYETISTDPDDLRDTQVIRGGVGFSYLFNRRLSANAGYVYERQESNAERFEYRSNRFYLALGLEL